MRCESVDCCHGVDDKLLFLADVSKQRLVPAPRQERPLGGRRPQVPEMPTSESFSSRFVPKKKRAPRRCGSSLKELGMWL